MILRSPSLIGVRGNALAMGLRGLGLTCPAGMEHVTWPSEGCVTPGGPPDAGDPRLCPPETDQPLAATTEAYIQAHGHTVDCRRIPWGGDCPWATWCLLDSPWPPGVFNGSTGAPPNSFSAGFLNRKAAAGTLFAEQTTTLSLVEAIDMIRRTGHCPGGPICDLAWQNVRTGQAAGGAKGTITGSGIPAPHPTVQPGEVSTRERIVGFFSESGLPNWVWLAAAAGAVYLIARSR